MSEKERSRLKFLERVATQAQERDRQALMQLPKVRKVRDDWATTWARQYDKLNGAPENDGDR